MHSLFKALEIVADAVIPTMPRVLRNALTLGCVLIAASAVAGTLLWIPYTRRRISDGAARREKRMQQQTDDAAFDAMFWNEYDAMMVATTTATGSGAENADMDLDPVTVSTPQGDVSMTYVPGRGAFGYYTDRRGSVTYPHLETVARKFLLHHARPDLARLAYADRRLKGVTNEHVSAAAAEAVVVDAIQVAPVAPVPTPSQSIFARLRSYNRKLGDDSSAAQAAQAAQAAAVAAPPPPPPEYTRFVWLGTLYDLAEASKSSPDYERVDYDYAEFKRLNPVRSSASSPPELEPKQKPEPAVSAASAASAASSDSDE